MALAVGVSLATLVLHSLSLFVLIRPVGDEFTQRLVSQLVTVAAAMRAVAPEERDRVAAAVSRDGMLVSRTRPRLLVDTPQSALVQPPPFAGKLQAAIGAKVILLGPPSPGLGLVVAFPVREETWWISLSNERPSIMFALTPVLGSVILIATSAGLALVVGVRLITRPMSQLAQDMLARRTQLRQIPEPKRLSVELRSVIRSFNEMVSAVEAAAQSRRDLLAGVSHDLRTPLARLRLRVETECPEPTIDRLDADFLAISRIIDQFLAYAQGQAGFGGERHALGEQLAEIAAQYQGDGSAVDLLRFEGGAVKLPDLAVQRLMMNLIDNALTHGRDDVDIECWVEARELRIVVYDHGTGLSLEELQRATQPFVRLSSDSGQSGHCGLGLAIVAQIAEQLGGRVICTPFDGMRSGVGVSLPLDNVGVA